jgi:hypothetical protein
LIEYAAGYYDAYGSFVCPYYSGTSCSCFCRSTLIAGCSEAKPEGGQTLSMQIIEDFTETALIRNREKFFPVISEMLAQDP